MLKVRLVNFFARMSITRYNKSRPARYLFRKLYQFCSMLYCLFSPLHHRNLSMMRNGEILDTYPWPYNDPLFANWFESDEHNDYSLIPDPSGAVIRYSTSYCAYKIYETTGSWPKRISKHRRFDARDWRAFLREAGYWEVDENPSDNFFYVGVRKDNYHSYGEVVWFERHEGKSATAVLVTTYDHKVFVPKIVHTPDYAWVKIARRPGRIYPQRVLKVSHPATS